MVSMYPYCQPTDYNQTPFIPYPENHPCVPCGPRCQSKLGEQLRCMGYTKFAEIVRISGLTNLDDRELTVFVPPDSNIPDGFVRSCDRLLATNIVRSSLMERKIPKYVFAQSDNAFYRTMNPFYHAHIKTDRTGNMTISTIPVLRSDITYGKLLVFEVEQLVDPPTFT